MVVNEHHCFWKYWSMQTYEKFGDYEHNGALVLVSIDIEMRTGRTEEPNVWVAHC
jgi:hypothetical protein